MSAYGAPPTGPQQGYSSPTVAATPPLFELIAAGIGVLSFLFGFLDFYSGAKGFTLGQGPIGLSILAAAISGAVVLSAKAEPIRPPYALAAAATGFLLSFGALLSAPSGVDAKAGLYLVLLATVAQTGVLAFSWLQASGRIAAPKPAAVPQWGGPTAPQGYGQPPHGYGQPQGGYGAPENYAPPTSPQGPPPGPPSYNPPSAGGYGPPQQPNQPNQPTPPPTGGGYQPPQPPPSGYGQH